jgi:hypothetical protein
MCQLNRFHSDFERPDNELIAATRRAPSKTSAQTACSHDLMSLKATRETQTNHVSTTEQPLIDDRSLRRSKTEYDRSMIGHYPMQAPVLTPIKAKSANFSPAAAVNPPHGKTRDFAHERTMGVVNCTPNSMSSREGVHVQLARQTRARTACNDGHCNRWLRDPGFCELLNGRWQPCMIQCSDNETVLIAERKQAGDAAAFLLFPLPFSLLKLQPPCCMH